MPLTTGTKLGPYEILAPIGTGGMGEVYKANDTRLDRTVAIKVLPSHLADNPDLKQRFEREARAVSSLNHPHICTLHDIGEQDGTDFLVMEYIEGETLAVKLTKGALPLDKALEYAIQIADALDKAHRQGVVHRDLKPGNIMLTKSGAKLLDFGLAKLKASAPGQEASVLSALPTEQKPLTKEGTILGTFQYMAPEQLEGKDVDARTDIFAFGSVLYEMVTGKRAFEGKSQASLIGAIMEHDPQPLSEIQPTSPRALDYVIGTCLAKDPDERWQNAGDVARQINWIDNTVPQSEESSFAGIPGRKRERLVWAAISAILLLVSLSLASLYLGHTHKATRVVQFTVEPPENATFSTSGSQGNPAISPDGNSLAFAALDANAAMQLWIRHLGSLVAQPLPGTHDPWSLFWSPDSRQIIYHSGDGKLMKLAVDGGPPETLSNSGSVGSYGDWSEEGSILFTPDPDQPLHLVSADGVSSRPVTNLDTSRGELRHIHPQFLPDGRHFLYFARSSEPENNGMYVGSLDSSETKRLLPHNEAAVFSPTGHVLFVRDQTLLAQPFNVNRLEVTGPPVPIASPVGSFGNRGSFSVSENGTLAYRARYFLGANSQLTWFDREGKQLGTVSAPAGSQNPEISPDGTRLAVERRDPDTGARDIWLVELSRGVTSRFTFHAADDSDPLWSPDGSQLAFSSFREGYANVFLKAASGAGDAEIVSKAEEIQYAMSWSSDGQNIITMSPTGLRILPVTGERRTVPFLQTDFAEFEPQFSPNGRWVSYTSNESGRAEIYVQSFPAGGGKWQISTGGGNDARWRPDGQELFYIAPDRKLMAVQVNTEGEALAPSTPVPLFQTRISGVLGGGLRFNYAVGPDGERFLIATDVEGATDSPIIVVLNWPALLDRN